MRKAMLSHIRPYYSLTLMLGDLVRLVGLAATCTIQSRFVGVLILPVRSGSPVP
jgi:hypothetical protein